MRRTLLPLVSVLGICAGALAQSTSRANVGPLGVEANSQSASPSLSADGRRLAFQSSATNLVPAATNPYFHVYVRDPAAGTTSLASASPGGAEGSEGSYVPALSADGRWIAFMSFASNFGPPDANPLFDVYVRDLVTGMTTMVTLDSAEIQPTTGASGWPAISFDGRFVAFESTSTGLVPGDTNGSRDVFVRDVTAGTTVRASVDSAGVQGNSLSTAASISGDGRFVTFESSAANLVSGDTNGWPDVFVRDLVAGTTVRASVSSGGVEADGRSFQPAISADGRLVAFASAATNLVPGDTNGLWDVFVRDLQTGMTRRVSVGLGGGEGNGDSGEEFAYAPVSISADGRFVAFESLATNLVLGDTNGASDVFVHDSLTGAMSRESVNSAGGQSNGASYAPVISADGRWIGFESAATNLVAGDANGWDDIFLRDRGAGSSLVAFCAGDGSSGPCPCANNGAAGRGCENSSATGGALLTATGQASLAADTVQLTSTGERLTSVSILVQGNRAIAAVAFGDGLRCAGGSLKRLYVKNAIGGTVVAPSGSDPSISARSAALGDPIGLGTTRIHQVHYRDGAPSFCPAPSGTTFNASSAIAISWGV